MADSALRLSLPKPSNFFFHSSSDPRLRRFPNPRIAPSHSHLLHCSFTTIVLLVPVNLSPSARRSFSYGSGSAADEEYGKFGEKRRQRASVRRRRKRQRRLEELLENGYDYYNGDDDDDNGGGLKGILEEVIANVWIFKVLKSFGYLLPIILVSFLAATGPKPFLTALAVAAVPSLLFLAFQKLAGRHKRRRKPKTIKLGTEKDKKEEEKQKTTWIGYNSLRFGSNGSPPTTGHTDYNGSVGMTSRFGGWNEEPVRELSQANNERVRKPVKKRVRREDAEPMLLRFLVPMFPFLSSWTNMLRR